MMNQLSLFSDAEPCEHEVKHQLAHDLHISYCTECGQPFYYVYKWNGTEQGAYLAVYSHPLPEGVADDDKLRRFLRCLSDAGWKTNETGLVTQHGGEADFLEAYKSFTHGVLLPF